MRAGRSSRTRSSSTCSTASCIRSPTGPPKADYVESFPGRAVDYDFNLDVGLIVFRPGRQLPASRVVPAYWQPRSEPLPMKMLTVGCSEGKDATAWHTRIMNPRMKGFLQGQPSYEAIECENAPKQGRSGGGLFTTDGYIAGVCNFAEPQGNHGLYATPRSIYALLDRNNLAALYAPVTGGSGTLVADGRRPSGPATAARPGAGRAVAVARHRRAGTAPARRRRRGRDGRRPAAPLQPAGDQGARRLRRRDRHARPGGPRHHASRRLAPEPRRGGGSGRPGPVRRTAEAQIETSSTAPTDATTNPRRIPPGPAGGPSTRRARSSEEKEEEPRIPRIHTDKFTVAATGACPRRRARGDDDPQSPKVWIVLFV